MYLKLFLSLLLIFLGLYLIINGSNGLHQRHPPPETFWQKTENFFTKNPMWNPIIKFFGGTPIPETPHPRKAPALVTLVTGILLFAGGILIGIGAWRKGRH